MSKTKVKIASDAEIDAAIARARAESDDQVLADSIKYHPSLDIFILNLTDGSRLVLQREKLQGLEAATKSQLTHVAVSKSRTMVNFDELDVHLIVPELIEGIYGTKRWMARIGVVGGSAKSKRKTESARANGRKGGRPRKLMIAS